MNDVKLWQEDAGSAAIEAAVSVAALVLLATLSYDLNARIANLAASARIAATMAHFLSHEAAPQLSELQQLAASVGEHEARAPADAAIILSAMEQEPGKTEPTVLWNERRVYIGDAARAQALANECYGMVTNNGAANLQASFMPMPDGEVIVISEICMKLTREGSLTGRLVGDKIYRVATLAMRDQKVVPAPPS